MLIYILYICLKILYVYCICMQRESNHNGAAKEGARVKHILVLVETKFDLGSFSFIRNRYIIQKKSRRETRLSYDRFDKK